MNDSLLPGDAFNRLYEIMNELREKCPWDRKQTFESLRILTLEEVYELSDAILEKEPKHICEELGDVLLHILFYAKLGSEENTFDIHQVIDHIQRKLIHRHPHIYGDVQVENEEEVKANWEKLKMREKKSGAGVLDGVPASLPAMIKAWRLQEKTAQVGFEWSETSEVWAKVQEELLELEEAVQSKDPKRMQDEFGDVLFALVNYARFIKVEPDTALEQVNMKFIRRFTYIESQAGGRMGSMSLDEMDHLWNEAKQRGL